MAKTKISRLLMRRSTIEILEYAKDSSIRHFNDFVKLKGIDTKKYFSPKTISQRLKELTQAGILEKVVSNIKYKNVVAYRITEKGLKVLNSYLRFEDELE